MPGCASVFAMTTKLTFRTDDKNLVIAENDYARVTAEPRVQKWTTDYRGRPILNMTHREWGRLSRVSVWGDNPESLIENLANRTRRPNREWKKLAVPHLSSVGIHADTMRWSQYAFCTCPCSPGFVLPERYHDENYLPLDFTVFIKSEIPLVDENKPSRFLAIL